MLGVVQGATEFLPVSSSGHVALGALILGHSEFALPLVVVLHVGTLLATVVVLHRELGQLSAAALDGIRRPAFWAHTEEGRLVLNVLVATLLTAWVGLLLEPWVEPLAQVPWVLGLAFLVSAAVVASTRRGGGRATTLTTRGALLLGVAQGLAVFPGLSRSGTTIACGMMLGLSGPAAFRISFLLSIPAVLGATLLALRPGASGLGLSAWLGGGCAAVVGYVCLFWLRRLVQRGRFWAFALYLVPLGLGLIGWSVFDAMLPRQSP